MALAAGRLSGWYCIQYYENMTVDEAIGELEGHETNVRFARLLRVCAELFGKSRIAGSHHIFETPWAGDPRINLQKEKGKAKPYQVKQVVQALKKLKETDS